MPTIRVLGVMFGVVPAENVNYLTGWYLDRGLASMLIIACAASVPWARVFARLGRRGKISQSSATAERGGITRTASGVGSYGNTAVMLQNAAAIVLLLLSVMSLMSSTYNPFIYFRF